MRGLALAVILALGTVPAICQKWNPKQAARYLDARQQAWNSWPAAKAAGGQCFSCHTQMTYLLARPSLRRVLGESQPTPYEKAALEGLRARVAMRQAGEMKPAFAKEPLASESLGVETIFAALFLARYDRDAGKMSPATEQAFDRLWALQSRDGKAKGGWSWFELDLDPWETGDSPFFGAALAQLAVRTTPLAYRERTDVRKHAASLTAYLQEAAPAQPLHNRLMLLWTGGLSDAPRRHLIEEALSKQQPDGGWTLASLGTWKEHAAAPASSGSNGYATAFTAFALAKGGVDASNPAMSRALEWLRLHQNPAGYWEASSMNKRYDAGSMQEQFMRDAATGFAAATLSETVSSPARE